jgi:hypothetical protein
MERKSTKNHSSSTSKNEDFRSQNDDSAETNRRKSSIRRQPSNTDPENEVNIPLVERRPSDRITRLPNTTTRPSDDPPLSRTTRPPDKKGSISSN